MAGIAPRPTLFLIAGPNGAGKSTFYDTVLAGRIAAPFVNADLIQRDEMRDPSPAAAYRAARIADARRDEHIEAGRSFVMETVFSHPSKLDQLTRARDAGFRLVVFHLNLASDDLAVARVEARSGEGGHDVPEDKVRARYRRNCGLIRQAALLADRAQVFDSSRLNAKPDLLLELAQGRATFVAERIPQWCASLYGDLV